jgi:hypothetical protein
MDPRRPVRFLSERVKQLMTPLGGQDYDPNTLRSVPSWGLSVLLHAFFLLLLALLIHVRQKPESGPGSFDGQFVPGEIGDVTSLVEAPRSGDPFTNEQSLDPPSLGLQPADPEIKFAAKPSIPAITRFGPELAGPAPLAGLALSTRGTPVLPGFAEQVTAPFSGRQGLGRAELVRREGGTVHSEKAVERALEWLVRHQRPDGSWSMNFQEQCQANACPSGRAVESDTAATGLALLPLLGAGYIHTVKCRHQDAVRRGLEALVQHQQPNGDLYLGGAFNAHLYSHAIGTMALCEAYGLSRDPRLKAPAMQALSYICEAQDGESGGWRYFPGQRGDTSVFGWQIFALRSGHMAGLHIPREVLRGCSDYLNLAAADPKKITYSYLPSREATPVMTAEALVSRQLLGWKRDNPSLVKGAGRIAAHLEKSEERNIYYWYYATQLLHNLKNKDWEKWNPHVREELIKTQVNDDSCAAGSWDPSNPSPDRWGEAAGRLFQTSLSILTLEVYYRYLPLYRSADTEALEAPATPKHEKKKK